MSEDVGGTIVVALDVIFLSGGNSLTKLFQLSMRHNIRAGSERQNESAENAFFTEHQNFSG